MIKSLEISVAVHCNYEIAIVVYLFNRGIMISLHIDHPQPIMVVSQYTETHIHREHKYECQCTKEMKDHIMNKEHGKLYFLLFL